MKEQLNEQWQEICHVTILDPDGWDRKSYDQSWYELITRSEFEKRMITSTVQCSVSWESCIWKDQPYRILWYIKKFFVDIYRKIKKLIKKRKRR